MFRVRRNLNTEEREAGESRVQGHSLYTVSSRPEGCMSPDSKTKRNKIHTQKSLKSGVHFALTAAQLIRMSHSPRVPRPPIVTCSLPWQSRPEQRKAEVTAPLTTGNTAHYG